MNNQPVLYDSLKTILHHMNENLRINMSQRMPSIRATEKAVPLRIRYLSISDTTVEINHVCYDLSLYRGYPNEDILRGVNDFDRFGFEIPIGSSPILPRDVSVRNGNERVERTDTDELEEHFQTELTSYENLLQIIAEKEEKVVTSKCGASWNSWLPKYRGRTKDRLQEMADRAREQLKPFHCRRRNLPRPFNCYIQLSINSYNERAKPLQRLVYNRKLYEAVKQFNHVLFANRPVIQVKVLECRATQVYRIPVGLKISANELRATPSQIGSIAEILEGDVNTLRVFRGSNWLLMFRTLQNKVVRFHLRNLTTEECCERIEIWMSLKREVGSELWVGFEFEKQGSDVLKRMQTRMKVIGRDERCVRLRGEHGKHIEACMEEQYQHMIPMLELKIKLTGN